MTSKATRVEVTDGNIELALKRFKVSVQRSGIPSEVKKRRNYIKPNEKRKMALKKAKKNNRRKAN